MFNRRGLAILLLLFIFFGSAILLYQLPPIHDRLAWRLAVLQGEIQNWIAPPPETLATPDPQVLQFAQGTLTAMAFRPTPTIALSESPLPSVTPTDTPFRALLPDFTRLAFPAHEWQTFNNCGPASLSMMLQFWGWAGDQKVVRLALRPNEDDKNVMPDELTQFASEQTGMDSILRTGGSLNDLRGLIAAGFPVMIEMGFTVIEQNSGWMGHYALLGAYDDGSRQFLAQDSYRGPDFAYTYDDVMFNWRAFNFTYLTAFPKARKDEVMAILGPNADPVVNRDQTLALASRETAALQGESLTYAFFNLGTNHLARQEYSQAAAAYDQARSLGLPYRFLWYQTGPYAAYYYSRRYNDVIDLTNATLAVQDRLEESWYWRGMSRMALGDREGAIADWRMALVVHPQYAPAARELSQAGATP